MRMMRALMQTALAAFLGLGVSWSAGCASSGSAGKDSAASSKSDGASKSAAPAKSSQPDSSRKEKGAAKPKTMTAANNPTTMAGRGAPDIEDRNRPAAWIYIDGKAGLFKEQEGHQLLQWFTDGEVSSAPTFRVEAYEPLLGTPKDFKAVLRSVEAADGSDIVYGILAYDNAFEVGQDYSLLNPGESFIIRNGQTGDVVKEIAPLSPGTYALAAGVKNAATGKETLAVTYFTVGAK